jgi:hypothetical protein
MSLSRHNFELPRCFKSLPYRCFCNGEVHASFGKHAFVSVFGGGYGGRRSDRAVRYQLDWLAD